MGLRRRRILVHTTRRPRICASWELQRRLSAMPMARLKKQANRQMNMAALATTMAADTTPVMTTRGGGARAESGAVCGEGAAGKGTGTMRLFAVRWQQMLLPASSTGSCSHMPHTSHRRRSPARPWLPLDTASGCHS